MATATAREVNPPRVRRCGTLARTEATVRCECASDPPVPRRAVFSLRAVSGLIFSVVFGWRMSPLADRARVHARLLVHC